MSKTDAEKFSAERAAKRVSGVRLGVSDSKVTLTGHAPSWKSIEDSANAAWATPGVTEAVDQVTISMASFRGCSTKTI